MLKNPVRDVLSQLKGDVNISLLATMKFLWLFVIYEEAQKLVGTCVAESFRLVVLEGLCFLVLSLAGKEKRNKL